MNLAELLRTYRDRAELSQEALAAAAGLSPSTIIRAEGGRLMPYPPNLFALAKALDIPLDELEAAVAVSAGELVAPGRPT